MKGSISIDKALIKRANLFLNQKVDIYNCNNGARFSTYIIEGKKGEICLNGAAARHVQKGDVVIIVSYASIDIMYNLLLFLLIRIITLNKSERKKRATKSV